MLRSLVAGIDLGERGKERGGRGRGRLRGGLSDDGTFPIAFRSACAPPLPPQPAHPCPALPRPNSRSTHMRLIGSALIMHA